MNCPYCATKLSKVVDAVETTGGVRRHRECRTCGRRFTTLEHVQSTAIMVVKRDDRREEFQREKLLRSLRVATRKRPIAAGAVEAIVDEIERRLAASGRVEVTSRVVGEMAITHLKTLDPIAYIRFASVYRQFVSLDEFLQELSQHSHDLVPPPEQARLFEDDLARLIGDGPTPPAPLTTPASPAAKGATTLTVDGRQPSDPPALPDQPSRTPTPIGRAPSAARRN